MANITSFVKVGTTNRTRQDNNLPYLAEITIDFADALVAKGSALAASDTIEALSVPAGTVVLAGGAQVITAADSTTLTVDVGYTGGTVDHWVDGFDAKSADGTYSSAPAGDGFTAPVTTAGILSVLFATLTGTLTTGKLRVWAILQDVSAKSSKKDPGIAQVGS